ncbi:MAG: hypothetical protein MI757_09810, partial [Pirellulales bacterium]|nr:hypothetical protein [Pirellulales bacterium]
SGKFRSSIEVAPSAVLCDTHLGCCGGATLRSRPKIGHTQQESKQMPEASNDDHWGSLASDLGAQPQKEQTVDTPDDQSEPEHSVEDSGEFVAQEEQSEEPVAMADPADDVLSSPLGDDQLLAEIEEPSLTAEDGAPPSAESDEPPIPDFFEAVRREAERSESVEKAEWPVVPADVEIEPAHDVGESIRNSPELPLDIGAEDEADNSDDSEGIDAAGEPSEDSEEAASQPEEKSGRRRRRRRGRRGGKSRRGGESEGQPNGGESDVAEAESIDSARHDQEDAVVDEDDGDVEPQASEGSDRPKHRNIPTWPEAIGMIVDSNLESRSKSPSAERGRGRGRGRGGRRRGKSGSKEKK